MQNIVGKGSYGVIYKSSIDKKDIVIKMPNENNYEDDLDENIIQNELFCAKVATGLQSTYSENRILGGYTYLMEGVRLLLS